MSVKFSPGPHPTSRTSSSVFPSHDDQGQAVASDPAALTIHAPNAPNTEFAQSTLSRGSVPRSPIMITFNRRPSNNNNSVTVDDPERQPLIPTNQLNRRRVIYPVLIALVVIILLGIVIFGGWRLGKGETGGGSGRWPGGPVVPPDSPDSPPKDGSM